MENTFVDISTISKKEHGFAAPDRTKAIVQRRLEGATLVEIGAEFGLTGERIRQICSKKGWALMGPAVRELLSQGKSIDDTVDIIQQRYRRLGIKANAARAWIETIERRRNDGK